MDLADLTAPTVTQKIGGVDYVFTPLTWRDISELQLLMQGCQRSPLELVREHLKDLPEPQQLHLLELAWKAEEQRDRLSAYEVEQWQGTREGRSRAWWLMLKHEHPGVTLDVADNLGRIADAEQTEEKGRLSDLAEKEADDYLKTVIRSKIDQLVAEGIELRLVEMNGASAKKNSLAATNGDQAERASA